MKISVVIPAYNEEENLPEVAARVKEHLAGRYERELIFVDDGSRDGTQRVLRELRAQDPEIHYVLLSRNFGHQSALRAGIDYATGDCVISLDADLQHPPRLLPELLGHWLDGYDIVYTQRQDDERLPWLKRQTSSAFYRVMNGLSSVDFEPGTADYRLIDRRVADVVRSSPDVDLFLRGFVHWAGFRQKRVAYTPDARFRGTTKYTVRKMVKLALNGITSFSVRPLHFATLAGVGVSGLAFLYALYALFILIFTDDAVPGWASVLISVLFIGGIQLLVLGIMGEYLGKLFIQAKQRPPYLVSETDSGLPAPAGAPRPRTPFSPSDASL
ncbi:glycosyltransferase family 2 protein [Hymenobacter sp. HSC-4F20]|uniref:glycosyltransferase family 2 protein n=1 Tax=Hymenobacter sp. HSC-4F20 TaxID=2864135 RepID=UPI001C733186|nr:glycosyltransferase family 2 protein [Hymenobacter sp. HSC-4F20]MBX0292555.1 glycosyltransferase family 2 protein [Hymenobacter sp. HSC-4F20]